jgi:hypothetical protein
MKTTAGLSLLGGRTSIAPAVMPNLFQNPGPSRLAGTDWP